ncbi:tetratricopeptide repeat protein [Streptomyces sp. HD]|uniref:tetratricopeptide repeat protein n=1 Tax=Streptomyces sp. HD TaxID=3020892 RepID=UPI00232AFC52|nr:tetratricopeptide repeat protein [Streptomyces sp. HD]MDC0767483.1 tetratricopeptide repeat protein [Streptomyces sp. HD]
MAEASGERAVAAGGDVRNIATGDHVQQIDRATVLPAEALVPVGELAKRLVDWPVPTRVFVGRERELRLLDDAPRVVCVHGLGGIGKSTLVAKWVRDGAADFNPVWWITADTPAAIDAGLTGLAMAMQPQLVDVLPQQALRERALQWLATHDGWLIALDNVSEPADVLPLLERVPGGRFVITSRRGTGWHGTAGCVDLDVLDTGHAAELFERICPGGDGADVSELVEELGNLPLAVEQAAAFCREAGTSARRYLELLAEYPADMFGAAAEGGDPERTVARVWRVTLSRLAEGGGAAVDLLHVLAWFAPDGIPRSLLEPGANPVELTRALGRLAAHSMISMQGDTLSVHRLVQAVARTPGEHTTSRPGAIAAYRDHAIRLLLRSLPAESEDVATWPAWRSLMPHVEALVDRVKADEDTEELSWVEYEAGLFLMAQGEARQAVRLLDRALATFVRLLGAERPEALAVATGLAQAHAAAGNFSVAIPLAERTCQDGARILGEDDPRLWVLHAGLGTVHYQAGNRAVAMELYARSLRELQRTAGPDDLRTLRAEGSLLTSMVAVGEAKSAVPLLRQYLADCVRMHGEDHPVTLTARNNLAGACQDAGDVEQAIELLRRNADDHVRLMGASHWQTLAARQNLGCAYHRAGRASEAVVVLEQVLEDCVRSLGEDHPDTHSVRADLAEARESLSPPE